MSIEVLDKIMKPKTVAVMGASTRDHTIGSDIMKRLTSFGFTGKIYPVNVKGGMIEGVQSYKKLADIPDQIDMAIIVINVKFVLDAIDECNEKGIKGLVIITSGFKETGPEGAEIERQLAEKVKKYGMRCVGPNGLGVVNTHPSIKLDGCFAEALPERGSVGLVSQSGALGGGMLNVLKDLNFGISQFISIGNQMDINAETALEYWENDDDVHEIMLYMESVKNPENFRKLATRISKKKPIIALKAGRTSEGAAAAISHTGSLSGADKAANALLKQSGCIREFSLKSLFDTSKCFSNSPIPKGDRVAIITNSGGPGIMATDAIVEYGLKIAKLSETTVKNLKSFLPTSASVKNPIDMIASAPIEHYIQSLEAVQNDENVDMILCIYLPFLGLRDIDVANALMDSKRKHPDKPLLGVLMTNNLFFTELANKNVNMPFYLCSEEAAAGLNRLNQQRIWINKPEGKIKNFSVNKDKASEIMKIAAKENRNTLTTNESMDLFDAYGIKVCQADLAKNEEEAIKIAARIGYPVVIKMSSKTISHKTDVGGVITNINSEEELKNEYHNLMNKLEQKNMAKDLEGIIVQQEIKGQREMVCGVSTDPNYGKLLMFGLGGIFIEIMKDVAFKLLPITDIDAKDIIQEVKSNKLLGNFRGSIPANIEQIEETLMRLSQLCTDFDFITELDMNPLLICDKTGNGIPVDGRIVMNIDKAKLALNC